MEQVYARLLFHCIVLLLLFCNVQLLSPCSLTDRLALFWYFAPSNQLVVLLGESNDDSKLQQIVVNQLLQHNKRLKAQEFGMILRHINQAVCRIVLKCRKISRALFSWKTRFEIRLFALLPTKNTLCYGLVTFIGEILNGKLLWSLRYSWMWQTKLNSCPPSTVLDPTICMSL